MRHCTICNANYDDGISFCPVDGEVLEDDPSSIVNTVLDGQYQVESLLGKGGMGAVFLARHILLGDRVAIKVLPPEMRNNAEWLRRFRREGQAARRFRHSNAVTVYDLRTAGDGTIYMVMEYVEGHTLDVEMKARGHFTPAAAVSALAPIMSVLNEAHAMGVVHRDLKPENIMFGKPSTGGAPQVKLLDLGIAKVRDLASAGGPGGGNTALTMAGQMMGTPYYMSPEQWGELPLDGDSEIDGRVDIYSLGLVLYEMIAGCRPYSAQTLLELRKEHVSVTPRNLSDVVADVPKAFSDVIARSMSKDRNDRQATAGQLETELKEALAAAGLGLSDFVPIAVVAKPPVSKPPAPTVKPPAPTVVLPEGARTSSPIALPTAAWESTPPSPRGSKSLVIGSIVALILIVGGVGGFFLVRSRGANPPAASAPKASDVSSPATIPATKEAMRYWLEVTAKETDVKSVRVAPMVPIASGQLLRFHFTPSDDGYLYLIGPGEKNEPTAFLTANAAPGSGTSNSVKKGVEFIFPSEQWLQLDKNSGSEYYTFVFSTTTLAAPQFLAQVATGRPLSSTEQLELTAFLGKYKTNSTVTETSTDSAGEPFGAVKVPVAAASVNPLVFELRIEHR